MNGALIFDIPHHGPQNQILARSDACRVIDVVYGNQINLLGRVNAGSIIYVMRCIKLDLGCINHSSANHVHILLFVDNLNLASCPQSRLDIDIIECTSLVIGNQNIAINNLTGLYGNI